MAQLFTRSANAIAKAVIIGGAISAVSFGFLAVSFANSPFVTQVRTPIAQPIPYSHQTHAGSMAINCRYCHNSVEKSSFAGLPSTETCMGCHSQVLANSPMLEPLRESYRTGQPIRWNRVNNTPEYVYFRHNIHVAKGVGCSTCHGRVDTMALTAKEHTLHMDWCLDCHKDPKPYLRPKSEIYNMAWEPPGNQTQKAAELAKAHGLRTKGLTDCYACHR